MHGASGLGLSATFAKAISGHSLLEERYLSWAEDEARVVSKAMYCLPKTSPCRPVFRAALTPNRKYVDVSCAALPKTYGVVR